MGFVVYEKEDGRAVRYYEREATAKTQVTKNNRQFTMAVLKGEIDYWNRYRYKEYAYCSWAEFETVVKENYSKQMARSNSF